MKRWIMRQILIPAARHCVYRMQHRCQFAVRTQFTAQLHSRTAESNDAFNCIFVCANTIQLYLQSQLWFIELLLLNYIVIIVSCTWPFYNKDVNSICNGQRLCTFKLFSFLLLCCIVKLCVPVFFYFFELKVYCKSDLFCWFFFQWFFNFLNVAWSVFACTTPL